MTNDKAAELFKALAAKAGFTPEQVNLALTQPEWKEIENRDNRHSEYSSALDKARNLEILEKASSPYKKWWDEGGGQWYEQSKEREKTLARYQERFGDIDPNNSTEVRTAAATSGLTMAQVQEMLKAERAQIGTQFSQMTNELLAITVHAGEQGIKLSGNDVVAMNKLMADKGVTYAAAYQELVGPRVREMEATKWAKEKQDAVDQAVKDALSRVGHAGNPPSGEGVSADFLTRPKAGLAENPKTDQELMAMWADAGNAVRK